MRSLRTSLGAVILAASGFAVLGADNPDPGAQRPEAPAPEKKSLPHATLLPRSQAIVYTSSQLPWDQVPASLRARVRQVVEQPKLSAMGTPEEFYARPDLYQWLLDHPDRAAQAWRQVGATCVEIVDAGQGKFCVKEEQGGEVTWQTVYRSPTMRIWFAEASAKPRPRLPAVPIEAVVILHHHQRQASGRTIIRHQADLYATTESKGASLLMKLMGNNVQAMAEQCTDQLQTFFSALLWHLERQPNVEKAMRAPAKPAMPARNLEPHR